MGFTPKILRALATWILVFCLGFWLLQAIPGDPADGLGAQGLTVEQAERTRVALGLDRPVWERFARTAMSYARGDFGVSYARKRPVAGVLVDALGPTAVLGSLALFSAVSLSLLLSVLILAGGVRARTAADRVALVVSCVPRFWLAVMLILIFHGWLAVLPASHMAPPGQTSAWPRPGYLVLPLLTLIIPSIATMVRFQLSSAERALASRRVDFARALGLQPRTVTWRHVLRPNLASTVALVGLDLPILVSGSLVVEIVFAWPGVGRVAAESLLGQDYPLALATICLTSLVVIVAGLLAEWAQTRIDPRQQEPA